MDISQIIGQILGFVAVVLGIVSYQVKSAKQLLFFQGLTCAVFSAHYLLLGAIPGAILNCIGIVRNIVYYHKDKKFYNPKVFPVVFAVIMLFAGWRLSNGLHSIFIIAGLVINTLCLSFKSAQNVRKSILVTCPMVIIYDIFEHSYGGVIYESFAMISAIVGIIRYKKNKTE